MASPSTAVAPSALPGRRLATLQRGAYRLCAVLVGVFFIVAAGAVYLTTSWFLPHEHPVHGVGLGVTMAILLGVAVLFTARNPEGTIAPFQQVLVVLIASVGIAVATASGNPNPMIDAVSLGAPMGLLLLLHPAKRSLVARRAGIDKPMLALALVGGSALAWYGATMAAAQLNAPLNDPMIADEVTRYAGLAGVAFALGLTGLISAFPQPGWRISAWCAGVGAALFGLASFLYPTDTGSLGTLSGLITAASGLLFVVFAERRHRLGQQQDAPIGS